MDELRESSLLFSLEGLLETERERVQREGREAERRREDELRRVAEVAERRRMAHEEERKARERVEALARERQRLEEERLEALKRATVERARIEAEARVRLVEADEQRKHELLLSKLHGEQRVARYQALSWLSSGGLLLAVVGAFAAYWGWLRPAQASEAQRHQSFVAESRVREQVSEQALRRERARSQALDERLRKLEADANRAAADAPALLDHPSPAKTMSGRKPLRQGSTKGGCGDSGDPLDHCLH